jgi:hypothetical protein
MIVRDPCSVGRRVATISTQMSRRHDLETIVRHARNWLHEFTMAEWQAI